MSQHPISIRDLWKPSQQTIAGRPAIELKTRCLGNENVELCLAGKFGEIWVSQGGTLRALVTRAPNGRKLSEEQLVRFGEGDICYWIHRLAIPEDPRDQTPYANSFGRRD